jgi:hypothetical protein
LRVTNIFRRNIRSGWRATRYQQATKNQKSIDGSSILSVKRPAHLAGPLQL